MKKILLIVAATIFSVNAWSQGFHYEPVRKNNNTQTSTNNYDNPQTRQTVRATTSARKGLSQYPMEIGGRLGMSFGNNTHILIAPTLGWQFSQYFAAGAGVNYIYHKYDDYWNYKESYLGFSLYGRARLLNYIALYVRPELNYSWGNYKDDYGRKIKLDGKFVPSVIVGAGIYIPAGPGSMVLSAYYDVVQDKRSPYGDNIGCSVGYVFGF